MSLLINPANRVSFKDLARIAIPRETDSYCPVSHQDLVKVVQRIVTDTLPLAPLKTEYGLDHDGQRMFSVMKFKPTNGFPSAKGITFSTGIVNSYNKSLAVKVASGMGEVMVCSNLCIAADVTYVRKHTNKIWDFLENAIIAQVNAARKNFEKLISDMAKMQARKLTDNQAYQILGLLYGREILNPTMLNIATRDWKKPRHKEFAPRTEWSLYNDCTQALKVSKPHDILERHLKLHSLMLGEVTDAVFN
jgi:hypothetical protein